MHDNGTGIHWHGIRQLHSTGMDGVDGITECTVITAIIYILEFLGRLD